MVKLRIGNSMCQITGVNSDTFIKLRQATSIETATGGAEKRFYRDKSGKRVMKWVPVKRTQYLMDKVGSFPTGLLYIVEDFLAKRKLEYVKDDTRIVPKLNSLGVDTLYEHKPYEPYPEQLEAPQALLEHGRGIIVGPTGVGKSVIAAEICEAFRVPTLIVVPGTELKKQLTDGLRGFFGREAVGPLKNGVPVHHISVENVQALDPKKPIPGIDLLIIDEFHHSGAKTYRVLNRKAWSTVYYKVGLTATPFRSRDDERLLLESVLSQVIYRIPYRVAVDKGYIVPLEAYYVELPAMKLKSTSNWHSVYKQCVVQREDRNEIIADMASNLWREGRPTLILTKQIDHGMLLQDMLSDRSCPMPFAEGKNQLNKELIAAFNRLEEPGLIGTVGVLGEGVDTKPAEWVFLAGGGKSKNQFMQNCGRVFRRFGDKESGKAILFYDPSHAWFEKHFNACRSYLLEEYGIIPAKLEI